MRRRRVYKYHPNKMIIIILLFSVLFIGMGYSLFSTSLDIFGNITVKKHSNYLYDVLKDAAEEGTYAKEYTGSHNDSFTEEPSKKIYHWYGSNDANGTAILDKNNVIFANHCWQMIRTTDTGGVKMIYNGEPENNQCLSTRGTHVGYELLGHTDLSSNYWYGTDYTYDSTTNTFKVSGTTEQATWNDSTYQNLIGKYTCKKTSIDDTCEYMYLVESYYSSARANIIKIISNTNYSQFGTLQFNQENRSLTYGGYMHGDAYKSTNTNLTSSQSFTIKHTLLSTMQYSGYIGYGDDIIYDDSANKYTLVNFTNTKPSNLTGVYIGNSDNNPVKSIYYVVIQPDSSSIYYSITLADGNLLSDYNNLVFGDSIIDNGDGTYTITNPTNVTLSDWYTNYANYKNKYTCNDSNTTCENPRYTTATTSTDYTYINAGEKIMIGKTRNGLTLTDTLLVRKDELVINSSNYVDYKYTCNTEGVTCTETNLRMITGYSATGYNYALNHYYGSSVTWDGTNYTLVDPIGIENYNNLDNISTHHYMCVSPGLTSCSTVAYIHLVDSLKVYYISLNNGIISVENIIDDMLTKNTTNSNIKSGIEAWYKHYMLDYDEYVEDTIFCNNRSISSLNGWDPNGSTVNIFLRFNEFYTNSNLSCTNATDQFSISNNNAKLNYKVGLMSSPEMNILHNNNIRKTGQSYWLVGSIAFSNSAINAYINSNGAPISDYVVNRLGVRPMISLIPGIRYSTGDGSMANPYIVYTRTD